VAILAWDDADADESEVEVEVDDEDIDLLDNLTPELAEELFYIEAEIEEELNLQNTDPEEAARREELDALVMSRARGVGALLGFAQNSMHPSWIRAKAMREIVRLEKGYDNALVAGAFPLGKELVATTMPQPIRADAVLLEKDDNQTIHAEYLARPTKAGFTLAMDLESTRTNEALSENALLHVTLFDRDSGASFKHAVAKLKRAGDALYHVDLFDSENLSQSDLERAEAVFWVAKDDSPSPPRNDDTPDTDG
jgi:hypothetical protein